MRRGHVVAGAAMNSEQRDERDGDRPGGINSSPYWARSSSLARALTLRYLVIIRGKVRAQSEQLKKKEGKSIELSPLGYLISAISTERLEG